MKARPLLRKITPEFRRRYLAAADQLEQVGLRCGARHEANLRRALAELGLYCLGGGLGYVYCELEEEDA